VTRKIDELLDVVMSDLRVAGLDGWRIQPSDWQDWEPSESALLRAPDGSAMGVWIDLSADAAQQLAELADQVQEWAVEELGAQRRPTNWPQCPAHPDNHPMQARVRKGNAVWACPSRGGAVILIGQLSGE
jgi:hypothetical protein